MTYKDYLDGLQLRYFGAEEITRQGQRTRGDTMNELPPKDLWGSIVQALWIADLVRGMLGTPIYIASAYRSPAYNVAVGGASLSQHKANTALDLIPGGIGNQDDRVQTLYSAIDALRGKAFHGGLGKYRSFVHVDTRGTDATWTG